MNKVDVSKITRCLRWLSNIVLEEYANGDVSEYISKKIQGYSQGVSACIDWDELTSEDMKSLGFLLWDETDEYTTWLIPMYLITVIPHGYQVVDMEGEPLRFNLQEADLESMYGCCKYGIRQPKLYDNSDEYTY